MTQFLTDVIQPQVSSILKRNESITKSHSLKVSKRSHIFSSKEETDEKKLGILKAKIV